MRGKREVSPENPAGPEEVRAQIEAGIRAQRLQARKGSYGLVLFVLISFFAIPDLKILPHLPDKVYEILGAPPKPEWISIALVVYVFSALTLTLARIMQGSGTYHGWSHLFYISSFYIFYGFNEGIRESFWAVFVSGLIILGLENYSIRTYTSEVIEREKHRLEKIEKSRGSGGKKADH